MILFVVVMSCAACSAVNMVAGAFRRYFVKGSRPRFMLATIQRATMWPGLIGHMFAAGLAGRDRAFFDLAWAGAGVGVWIWLYLQLNADDDDDWFKGAKKRLRKWALQNRLSPVASGA